MNRQQRSQGEAAYRRFLPLPFSRGPMASSSSAERYRLRDAFNATCARVLARVPEAGLQRSVAYWALSADRRLPVALLDRTLGEILETPFERLAATPGIGLKKMAMLNTLLRRAAEQVGWPENFADTYDPTFEPTYDPLRAPETGDPSSPSATTQTAPFPEKSAPEVAGATATGKMDAERAGPALPVKKSAARGTVPPATVPAGNAAPEAPAYRPAAEHGAGPAASKSATSAKSATEAAPAAPAAAAEAADIEPEYVSESLWAQWRQTARRNDLDHETLGRFAPSLHGVPTVIWHAPLGEYTRLSLAELRKRRTHGEKRIRVILQVFRGLHEVLGGETGPGRLALRPLPRFIPPVESWLRWAARSPVPVSWADVRSGLALPLINQVAIDAGPQIAKLVESRLGVEGVPETVLEQARRLGLTRARVYQLLEMCAAIMAVRWPEGRIHFDLLASIGRRLFLNSESRQLFEACHSLCFPTDSDRRPAKRRGKRRGASPRHRESARDTATAAKSPNFPPAETTTVSNDTLP